MIFLSAFFAFCFFCFSIRLFISIFSLPCPYHNTAAKTLQAFTNKHSLYSFSIIAYNFPERSPYFPMKIIHSASRITPAFPLEISVLLDTDASLDKILFFDIETTGFSPDSAQIYLIGCLYCKLSSAAATLPSYEKRSSVETRSEERRVGKECRL